MTDENLPIERRRAPELTARELHDLLRLRIDVFVVEQQCAYPELDGRDLEPDAQHWWIERDGQVASSIRLLADPGGGSRIGRVVTHPAHRGLGLAARLIAAAIPDLPRPIRLHAQAHLAPWYGSFGFEVCGPLFLEDGIDHLPMVIT